MWTSVQLKKEVSVEQRYYYVADRIDKRKLINNATKDTEDEGYDSDKKVFRAMRKLESWLSPEATKVVENYNHGREITLDQVNFGFVFYGNN
jgi:hypothetical protein